MNNRDFRQRIAEILERQRHEAEQLAKKPPATEEPAKRKQRRSP